MVKVYAANHGGAPQPNIGRGIGMAFGLWGLTIVASISQHQVREMSSLICSRAVLLPLNGDWRANSGHTDLRIIQTILALVGGSQSTTSERQDHNSLIK